MSLQDISMPDGLDPAAILSLCIDILCKRYANVACQRSACRTHCWLLGGCAIKTHTLGSMPPDNEQHDPELEVDVGAIQPTAFLPQMGPERVSEPHIDIDPAPILPQAGPFLVVGPVADVDIAQPMLFSSQAGPLCASELEADVGVQPIPRLKVTSMPADNKTMTPAPGGSSHSPHPHIPLSTKSQIIHAPQARPPVSISDEGLADSDTVCHLPMADTVGSPPHSGAAVSDTSLQGVCQEVLRIWYFSY